MQKNRAKKAGTEAKNTTKRRDLGPSRGPTRALKYSKAATGSVPPASPPSSPELQRARKFSKSDEEHKRASFLGEGAGAWNVRPGSEFYSRPGTATVNTLHPSTTNVMPILYHLLYFRTTFLTSACIDLMWVSVLFPTVRPRLSTVLIV